jgi:DUF4097 and DUF4098 domain-containing protein YvlB
VVNGAESDGTLEAATLSGDVRLTHVKARRLQANTVSGDVTADDVTCEGATLTTMSGDAVFSGPLAKNGRYELSSHSGDGSANVTLTTFNGDITIKK